MVTRIFPLALAFPSPWPSPMEMWGLFPPTLQCELVFMTDSRDRTWHRWCCVVAEAEYSKVTQLLLGFLSLLPPLLPRHLCLQTPGSPEVTSKMCTYPEATMLFHPQLFEATWSWHLKCKWIKLQMIPTPAIEPPQLMPSGTQTVPTKTFQIPDSWAK